MPKEILWVSVSEAARIEGVTRGRILQKINEGRYPSVHKVGSQYVINADDIKALKPKEQK